MVPKEAIINAALLFHKVEGPVGVVLRPRRKYNNLKILLHYFKEGVGTGAYRKLSL